MPNNLLDEIRNTNLTTINDSSEVDQQRNQTNINDNPRQHLNNALVAKVLEDIIVGIYYNEQRLYPLILLRLEHYLNDELDCR